MQTDAMTATSAGSHEVRECVRTYDRIAPVYDLLDGFYEWSWKKKLRKELFARVRGPHLLDAGVGTGCNMPFYPPGVTVTAIDTSRAMLARARERARELGRPVELLEMNLLNLQLADASVDTVAITFVLLCLPPELQGPALEELRRVVKPGGEILILDYHLSEKKGVRLWMRVLQPWLKWAFAARYDTQIERAIEGSGLEVAERRSFMGDGTVMLVLRRPDPPGIAG